MRSLLSKKSKIKNIVGCILAVIVFLLSIYTTIVSAAFMGVDKVNEWTISYFTAFNIDIFIFELWFNFLKLYLIRIEIIKGKSEFF